MVAVVFVGKHRQQTLAKPSPMVYNYTMGLQFYWLQIIVIIICIGKVVDFAVYFDMEIVVVIPIGIMVYSHRITILSGRQLC